MEGIQIDDVVEVVLVKIETEMRLLIFLKNPKTS